MSQTRLVGEWKLVETIECIYVYVHRKAGAQHAPLSEACLGGSDLPGQKWPFWGPKTTTPWSQLSPGGPFGPQSPCAQVALAEDWAEDAPRTSKRHFVLPGSPF